VGLATRRTAAAGAALAGALIACGVWFTGPAATPTQERGPGGTAYVSAPAPAGYLLLDPAYDTASLFSVEGQQLEVFTELHWWLPREASGAASTPLLAPDGSTQIAYLRAASEGVILSLRRGQVDLPLLSLRAPTGLRGSIPAGYLAVSDQVVDEETGSLFSVLYVIEAVTGVGTDSPALRLTTLHASPQPLPLAFGFLEGIPSTVYYSLATSTDASGSDLENRGLFVLDLATRDVSPFLDPTNRILGVSPDLTFVAFYSAERTPPEIRLARLDGGSTVLFQPLSGARESGRAVFSPDSSRVAWGTVVGGSGEGASFQLSLASTFGGPASLVDLAALLPSDPSPIRHADPVAWLTDSALLIQVERESSSAVYRYQIDSGEIGPAAAGLFITLLYP